VFRVGEKFYILIRYETAVGAEALPKRILANIGNTVLVDDVGSSWPDWKASAGVAELEIPLDTSPVENRIDDLLKHAEIALAKASNSDQNKVGRYWAK
jgi:PleD family two-component response regulator